jgi:predicted secreted Zn-dependent protease
MPVPPSGQQSYPVSNASLYASPQHTSNVEAPMRSIVKLAIVAIVVLAPGPETAQAAPAFSTRYSYYGVSGTSPTGIFASLLRNAQRINGVKHHAFTKIDIATPRTVSSANGCRVGGLSVRFLIRMPRLTNEASLSANDRRLWQQFSGFIRRHEETHRAIWMNCARRMDATLRGLRGRNCADVAQRARKVIEQVKPACRRQDMALDATDRGRFDNYPFMRAALAPIYKPVKTKAKAQKKSGLFLDSEPRTPKYRP